MIKRLKEWLKSHILGGLMGGLIGFGLRWIIISKIPVDQTTDPLFLIIAIILTGIGLWYGI
jgi:hypothetical protein